MPITTARVNFELVKNISHRICMADMMFCGHRYAVILFVFVATTFGKGGTKNVTKAGTTVG